MPRGAERVSSVCAESFPTVEVPSTTPDIRREDGTLIEVPMASLAGLVPGDDGMNAVEQVISRYESWIADQRSGVRELPGRHRPAAERHMAECQRSARRMRDGIAYIPVEPSSETSVSASKPCDAVWRSRSRRTTREIAYDKQSKRYSFSESYRSILVATQRPGAHFRSPSY